jgi:hypothetical protein
MKLKQLGANKLRPTHHARVTLVSHDLKTSHCVATLALGSQPKQGLVRLWAKEEAWGSHLMLPRVQKNVRE